MLLKNSILIQGVIFLIVILSIFIIIPKIAREKDKYIWGIYANVSLIFAFFFTAFNYLNAQREEQKEKNKNYANDILEELTQIDDYLFRYYDDLRVPFAIIYNKVQLPSSNVNLNKEFKNLSKKSKDLTFLLFNKITYLLEEIYFLDKNLFDNSILGLKIQLYINNLMYYEYWNTNKMLYRNEFQSFMNQKYKYLNLENTTYDKPDTNIYFIPKLNKYNFNYN